MTVHTAWRTDDPCPLCGTGLTATDNPDGTVARQECHLCGWSISWQAALDLDGDRYA